MISKHLGPIYFYKEGHLRAFVIRLFGFRIELLVWDEKSRSIQVKENK